MITSAVLLVSDASSNSTTALHDKLVNEISKMLGRWSFELKIFKSSNTQSSSSASSDSGFLYDVSVDYEPTTSVTVVNSTSIISTTDTPRSLLTSGCSNGAPDNFGQILQTKMQSLWFLRQTLKGENGNAYELRSGEFVIRSVNVFLHGNFKNFLIIIEHHSKQKEGKSSNKSKQLALKRIEKLSEELELPRGKLCLGTIEGEYLAVLASQLIEALQG